jgi:hypothetical protein
MKKVLLLMVAVLMIASVATADVIGVYTDATASSCVLAAGFTSSATVIHKFTAGATSSRWKIAFPAGTQFFSFATAFVPIGSPVNDLALGYGQCLSGSFALGTLVAILTPGQMDVLAADGFPEILYTDCNFGEHPGFGGHAYVAVTAGPCDPNASQNSTWGQVKALYR